jgi:hypothetical protein
LKVQIEPASSPFALTRKLGPESRAQESSIGISMSETAAVSRARACCAFPGGTSMFTGSNRAMALATSAYSRATADSSAHSPARQGQAIQQQLCGAHSAGMKKPCSRGSSSVSLPVISGFPFK